MAAFKVRENTPDRIVLGRGSQNTVGTLIGLGVFGALALWGLSQTLDGGDNSIIGIVLILIFGVIILSAVLGAAMQTQVIVDSSQRVASRTDSFLMFPIRRQELAFNTIRNVQVESGVQGVGRRSRTVPVWQVVLDSADGERMVLNQNGSRQEMDELAAKIAVMTNRSVGTPPETLRTPSVKFANLGGSLIGTMESMVAQATANPSLDAAVRRARDAVAVGTAALVPPPPNTFSDDDTAPANTFSDDKLTPANTFSDDNAPANQTGAAALNYNQYSSMPSANMTGAKALPYNQFSDGVPANQTGIPALPYNPYATAPPANEFTITGTMPPANVFMVSANAPLDMGSALSPPGLTMPAFPALYSMMPALNMPSMVPLGAMFDLSATLSTAARQATKEIQTQVAPRVQNSAQNVPNAAPANPNDAVAQAALGRRYYNSRNYGDALTAYTLALKADPANAAVQNDLGALLMQRNNPRQAEAALRRAIALDPFLAVSRYNLGVLLGRQGKGDAAREQFQAGLRIATQNEAALFNNALLGTYDSPQLTSAADR